MIPLSGPVVIARHGVEVDADLETFIARPGRFARFVEQGRDGFIHHWLVGSRRSSACS